MKFDRFTNPPERSMNHEKPESFPDDYKPQCECKQPYPSGFLKRIQWFSVGTVERFEDSKVRNYSSSTKRFSNLKDAKNELLIILMDYNRRGIAVPADEFCVIEHTETFYLV